MIETITVDGKERPKHNSIGHLIHATEDGIRNFYRWFGDSKVVDEQGRPLVFYHNTDADFTVFKKGQKDGLSGKGIYFSEYPLPQFGKPMSVYLKIENPITPYTELDGMREINSSGIPTKFIADIFDQFPQFDGVKNRSETVVPSPYQIKSATGNTGSFSESPDIYDSQSLHVANEDDDGLSPA